MKLRAVLVSALTTLGLGLGLVVAVSAATPAWACSCVGGNPDERAELIVVGTITEVREHGVRLAVDEVEKGSFEAGSLLSLRVGSNEAACGFPFSRGVRYRVPSSNGATSLCSGIRQVEAAREPAVASAAVAEVPGPERSASSRWLATGALLVIVSAGAMALALRRRKSLE